MPDVDVHLPTHVVMAAGVSDRVGEYAATWGTRALVVFGEQHARACGLFGRVERSLADAGMVVEVLEGVPPDPSTAVVDAGGLLARTWRADVVVAVGGGSVIDVAKAVATSAASSISSYRELLSGIRADDALVAGALPVVAVPTLPGSGSEVNGTSVIVDERTGRKLSATVSVAVPRLALIDTRTAASASAALLGAGVVDAWCHALEAALSTRASWASDSFAEQALRSLSALAPDLGAGEDEPAGAPGALLARAWWSTLLAAHALALAGSIVTHPLAHPLSARIGARHGEAVAAVEAAVIAALGDRWHPERLRAIAGWTGSPVRSGADAQRVLLTRFGKVCTALGVRSSSAELGLEPAHLDMVVDDALASGSRGLGAMPGGVPIASDLRRVLELSLVHGPTTTARRLMAAPDSPGRRGVEDSATPPDAQ